MSHRLAKLLSHLKLNDSDEESGDDKNEDILELLLSQLNRQKLSDADILEKRSDTDTFVSEPQTCKKPLADTQYSNDDHAKFEEIRKLQSEIIQHYNDIMTKYQKIVKIQDDLIKREPKQSSNTTKTEVEVKQQAVKTKASREINPIEEFIKMTTAKPEKMPEQYENLERVKYWRNEAEKEEAYASANGYADINGTATVLCIDTSESMREGDVWSRVRQFCHNYLDGMELLSANDTKFDNVGVVTFGHEVKVHSRLTRDFDSLRQCIDNLTLQGPSPMFAGLAMSAAVIQSLSVPWVFMNHLQVRPHLVLLTDGKPTELERLSGDDSPCADAEKVEQTKSIIVEEASRIKRSNIDVHCVYLGNGDRDFLRKVQETSQVSTLKTYKEGKNMAMYTIYRVAREGDQTFVRTIDRSKDVEPSTISLVNNKLINEYAESKEPRFPRVGTRVRRGDDWRHGNQDGNGAGTIIGHDIENSDRKQIRVYVEWDKNRSKESYCVGSGADTKSEIEPVGKDRIPTKNEILAVGAAVEPGEHFKEQNKCKRGVVIRMSGQSKAEVKWDDGSKGTYRFGKYGQEKEISPVNKKFADTPGQEIFVSEKQLSEIAQLMHDDLKMLGPFLDISNAEITRIESDFKGNVLLQIQQLLFTWRGHAEKPTLNVLMNAIEKSKIKIDWDLLNKITDKITEEHVVNP